MERTRPEKLEDHRKFQQRHMNENEVASTAHQGRGKPLMIHGVATPNQEMFIIQSNASIM